MGSNLKSKAVKLLFRVMTTASSLFQSVLGTTLLLSSNALTRKFSEYSLF